MLRNSLEEGLVYRERRKEIYDKFIRDLKVDELFYSPKECYIFAYPILELFKSVQSCYNIYKSNPPASEKLPDDVLHSLELILENVISILEIAEDETQIEMKFSCYKGCIETLEQKYTEAELTEKQSQSWQAIFSAMHVFANKELLTNINENLKFFAAIQTSRDNDVKKTGIKLLRKVCLMQQKPSPHSPSVHEIFYRSNQLIKDPAQYGPDYQDYARTLEGAGSRLKQVLGHTMKTFGFAVFGAGFLALLASILIPDPSLLFTGGLILTGIGAMWAGGLCVEKGDRLIEKGSAKKLANKMTLFSQSIRKSIKSKPFSLGNTYLVPAFLQRCCGR